MVRDFLGTLFNVTVCYLLIKGYTPDFIQCILITSVLFNRYINSCFSVGGSKMQGAPRRTARLAHVKGFSTATDLA